jgi:hypothetical protein
VQSDGQATRTIRCSPQQTLQMTPKAGQGRLPLRCLQ